MSRRALIEARITARTDSAGKPLAGYTRNVKALREELARLEQEEQRASTFKGTP